MNGPTPRSLRKRLLGPQTPEPRLRFPVETPRPDPDYVPRVAASHPWKQAANRWHESQHERMRPYNPERARIDVRLTAPMRGQLNDLIGRQQVSGAEVIRRAVAEYHWRYILGRVLPPMDDYDALLPGDDA